MPWQPIAARPLAAELRDAERAISDAFDTAAQPARWAGLRGDAGAALYRGYRLLSGHREADADRVVEHLSRGIDRVAAGQSVPFLNAGVAGLAFALDHLSGRAFDAEDGDPVGDIDDQLCEIARTSSRDGAQDLVAGLVGVGVYAIERAQSPAAATCAALVVERLAAWGSDREHWPGSGEDDLGLAHGAAGVIGFLGRAVGAGVAVDVARPVLDRALAWFLDQRVDGSFPRTAGATTPDRFAWCYGDPGIACSLLVAARATGDGDLEDIAVGLMRNVWAQPAERARVNDPMVCHGAAGLAHMFNRFFHATGDGAFADAARFWLQRTLELRRDGEGVAGFAAHEVVDGVPAWTARPGILAGAAGVGLVLLAATTDVEPAWDRVLLVSG